MLQVIVFSVRFEANISGSERVVNDLLSARPELNLQKECYTTSLVWNISDTLNGLMAVPSLIGLLFLTPVVVAETKKYFDNKKND